MHAIKGKYRGGQIVLDEKADWPEETEVVVEPVTVEPVIGMREEAWSSTPEAIADWLRWYDSLEPLEMTAEEETAWYAALREQKEYEKSKFEENARRAERLFE